jgi:tetratricopeptide (TPR) repeat protein
VHGEQRFCQSANVIVFDACSLYNALIMEDQQNKPHPKRRAWISIVAIALSALLVASILLVDAASIKISKDSGSDTQKAAAGTLAEGNDYIGQGEFARIRDVFISVFQSPQTLDDYYLLASMQIAQGKYEEALLSIGQCFKAAPASDTALMDDLWTKKGCLHAMLGDYDETLSCFARISDGGVGSADIVQIEAQIYIERGDLQSAEQCVGAYLDTAPDDTGMRLLMVQVCYLMGDYETAEAQYTALIDAGEEGGGQYHLLRASCREQLGLYEGAIGDYSRAAVLGYEDPGLCWAQCALCAYQLGLSEEALSYGALAEQAGSDRIVWDTLFAAMGISALQLGEYDQAAAYLTKGLEKNGSLADAYYYRGVACMALEQYETAAADFTASIAREERTAQCYFNRALCRLQAGQEQEAKADLELALSISDDAALTASAQLLLDQWK